MAKSPMPGDQSTNKPESRTPTARHARFLRIPACRRTLRWFAAITVALLLVSPAAGQANRREPYIGYLYPAGGQQGTTFQVLVGGQNLQRVSDAYVSGSGVHATVVRTYRPPANLEPEQRELLQQRMRELFAARLSELPPEVRQRVERARAFAGPDRGARRPQTKPAGTDEVTLREHPLLADLESLTLRGLIHTRDELARYRTRQRSAQIEESVLITITIDAKAAAGDREIRLGTPQNLTNPMRFQVGSLREIREDEPNDPGLYPFLPPETPLESPIVINGRIKPGDVDHHRFHARQGQSLVIEARARHLVPYVADAVPGWFQATLTLYDPQGRQVAFADDYRFDPDPVLCYEIPEDGVYQVEIRDAIYRGREDFVYRLTISEQPFITQLFPLGGRAGTRTVAEIGGWNLGSGQLPLLTPTGIPGLRQAALKPPSQASNQVIYAVDMLPESDEAEPNDTYETAQPIDLPRIINGRIRPAGDADVFSFKGTAGQTVVAEVHARRLHSPLDALAQLIDPSGRVVAWNDDHEDLASGLLTHHADSYLRVRLAESGTYAVRLADATQQGGDDLAYRLRISAPRADFALRVTPSSIAIPAGWSAPLCVYALRKDGFDGAIDIVLKDAPRGLTLGGGRVPRGQDKVYLTISAAQGRRADGPVALQLEGQARVGGNIMRRPVVPAEDMMQAFAYRHLVPSQELLALIVGNRRPVAEIVVDTDRPVRLVPGGTAEVRVKASSRSRPREVQFALRDPPAGVALKAVHEGSDGVTLTLTANSQAADAGAGGNLIVEAYTLPGGAQAAGQPVDPKQRTVLGILPAIPFEVVRR